MHAPESRELDQSILLKATETPVFKGFSGLRPSSIKTTLPPEDEPVLSRPHVQLNITILVIIFVTNLNAFRPFVLVHIPLDGKLVTDSLSYSLKMSKLKHPPDTHSFFRR